MLNVVELKWEEDPDVASLIEGIQVRAANGEIDAVAIAATTRDGGITTAYHSGRKLFPLIGAIIAVDQRLRQKLAS